MPFCTIDINMLNSTERFFCTAAGGTHPTGMHSCIKHEIETYYTWDMLILFKIGPFQMWRQEMFSEWTKAENSASVILT